METKISRRRMLQTVATGGAVLVAGCAGSDGGGVGATDPFASVEIDGENLVVELDDDSVDKVNVIGPGGEPSLGSGDVAVGASQVRFDLVQDYDVGEHTVVAVGNEGNEIGSTTQRLEPKVELGEVVTEDMTDRDLYGGMSNGAVEIELSNVGNAPVALSYVVWDNVPSFDDSNREATIDNPRVTGIAYSDDISMGVETIAPRETVSGLALSIVDTKQDWECNRTETAEITVGYQDEHTFERNFKYEEDQDANGGDCAVTVVN